MSKRDEKAHEARMALVERFVAAVTDAIEAGEPSTWAKTWIGEAGNGLPINASTGQRYRGGNIFALGLSAYQHGFDVPVWATANQWHKLGARVTDQDWDHYTVAIFWKVLKRTRELDTPIVTPVGETVTEVDESFGLLKHFRLYNIAQIEVTSPEVFEAKVHRPIVPTPVDPGTIPGMVEVFDHVPVTVTVGEPSYVPSRDVVAMPSPGSFQTLEHYAATLAHEYTHWTGHSSRLNRPLKGRRDLGAYAMEELVAELGAAMMALHLGIEPTTRNDHTQYLRSWVSHLADDPQALWTASTQASAAFEHLIAYGEAARNKAGALAAVA